MASVVKENSFYNPKYHPTKNTLYSFQNFECIKRHCKNECDSSNCFTLLPQELYKYFCFPNNIQTKTVSVSGSKHQNHDSLQGPFAICLRHFSREIQSYITDNCEWPNLKNFKKIFYGKNQIIQPFPIRLSSLAPKNQQILVNLRDQTSVSQKSSKKWKKKISKANTNAVGNPAKKKPIDNTETNPFLDLISMASDSEPMTSTVQQPGKNSSAEFMDLLEFNFEELVSKVSKDVQPLSNHPEPSTSTQITAENSSNSTFSSQETNYPPGFEEVLHSFEIEENQSSTSFTTVSIIENLETTSENFLPRHMSTSQSERNSIEETECDQLPKFKKFLKEIALPGHCLYDVDKASTSEFNYFGKLETIIYHPEKWSELELIQTVQKYSLKISHGHNWCDEYEASDKYILSGAFGEMRASTNHPKFVLTKKTSSLSALLELELIYKNSSFQSATNSLAGYLFLPSFVYCDKIIIVHVYKFAEICSTVSVLHQNKMLTEANINFVIREICKGLDFLHVKQIVLRNLSAKNIFVYNNQIQIGNFSFAIIETFSNNCILDFNTEMPQCSPEQIGIKEKKITEPLSTKIDIWAVGCLFAQLLSHCSTAPFSHDQKFTCYNDFLSLKPIQNSPIQLWPHQTFSFQPTVLDFLKRCLVLKSTNRPTASQLRQHNAVKHFSTLF